MSYRSSKGDVMSRLARLTNLGAPIYDLIFRTFWMGREKDFRQGVIELMNLSGGESVLDIGCGTGTLTSMIAQRMTGRGSVFGIDLSPRMVEVAKERAREQGNQVEYKVCSSLTLPFDNQTFDVVVTSLVYHQMMSRQERVRTLGEIRRVLKPGGRYIAAEFARFTLGNLWVTYDSLVRRIGLFSPDPIGGDSFEVQQKMETLRGITLISVRKKPLSKHGRKGGNI